MTSPLWSEGDGSRRAGDSHLDVVPQTGTGNRHGAEQGPRGIGTLLLRRKWLIAAVAVAAMVSSLILTKLATPLYTSTATVLVQAPPTQPNVPPNMATEKQVAESPAVARIVSDKLGLDIPLQELEDHLSLDVPVDTEILSFTYSSPIPAVAQERAEAFADAYLTLRRSQSQSEYAQSAQSIEDRIQFLTRRLQSVQPGGGATAQAQTTSLITQISILQEKLAEITPNQNAAPGGVVGRAPRPQSPSWPNTKLNLALGLFLGLLLGLGAAYAVEFTDDRIRSPRELKSRLGAPVLGTLPIPGHGRWASPRLGLVTLRDPQSAGAEAFRQLRTNFLFAAKQARARSLLVTSAAQKEGKTFVTANLAVALAQAGKRVILISADLRRPSLMELFDVESLGERPGLVDVLIGSVSLPEALRDVGIDDLRVLDGGSTPSNPAELLGSDRMATLLADLAEHAADFVLIDTPPLLAMADAAALAPACDGVVFVSDVRRTTRSNVARAREQLERTRSLVLGAVVLDPARGEPWNPAAYGSSDWPRRAVKKALAAPKDPLNGRRAAGEEISS